MSEGGIDFTTNDIMTNPTTPMRRPKIKLPKPQVHSQHPFVNAKNHSELRQYIQQRVWAGCEARNRTINRLCEIDKNVSGWMRLSQGDKDRQRKKKVDGNPIPVDVNLPITWTHIDDMMTYFAQTFAPTQGMFYQTGKPEEQKDATQIITIMNNHAIYGGYYPEVLQGLFAALKYNMGGFHCYWSKEQGQTISKDASGNDVLTQTLQWQGNKLEAIDNYNFFFDPSVNPKKISTDAEFAGVVKAKGYHYLQSKAAQGIYYNVEEALSEYLGTNMWTYYMNPPQQSNIQSDDTGGTDWKAILSETYTFGQGLAFEMVDIYIRLNPTEFGLIPGNAAAQQARNRLEVWKFTLLNNKYIIECTYMNNIHGMIPYYCGFLNDDIMSTSTKSVAELITPLQDFASSLINTHIRANRKNLWGNTYYDPTMFDLKGLEEGEVSSRIPMLPTAFGKDIKTGIFHDNATLDSKQTLSDLTGVIDIINQFFPGSSMPSQIASIDRAVDSQVAAVQQGVNRRQQKSARLLDETIFRNVRFCMYYNIIQYQPDDTELLDYYTGKPITIDLNSIRNTDLPFIIGQGLKAIDRQMVAKALQQIIFALIQAPNAAQGIDLLGLIDYWSSMIDIDTDLTQFRIQQPQAQPGQPQVGPDGQSVPAAGPAITPATNPVALTAPIRRPNAQPG